MNTANRLSCSSSRILGTGLPSVLASFYIIDPPSQSSSPSLKPTLSRQGQNNPPPGSSTARTRSALRPQLSSCPAWPRLGAASPGASQFRPSTAAVVRHCIARRIKTREGERSGRVITCPKLRLVPVLGKQTHGQRLLLRRGMLLFGRGLQLLELLGVGIALCVEGFQRVEG